MPLSFLRVLLHQQTDRSLSESISSVVTETTRTLGPRFFVTNDSLCSVERLSCGKLVKLLHAYTSTTRVHGSFLYNCTF
jgi:hypothetical protein